MDQRREATLAASRNPEPVSAPGKPACRRPSPPEPAARDAPLGLAGDGTRSRNLCFANPYEFM